MLKKKAFNRIFFTTIIFFLVFILYNLKIIGDETITKEQTVKNEELYTLNKDGYISITDVYVGKVFTLEDRIKEKLEIMTKENDKNALLPSYFKPILPENTKVIDVKVRDSLVKVYFSKELENITEEQSEKMIESIIYTITDENILGVEIYVDGEILKYIPHTKKELPTVLTRNFGINKVYDIYSYSNISRVIVNYYSNYNGEYYIIPITKYVNDNRELLEIIFDQLITPKNINLVSLIENTSVIDYSINNEKLIIDLDNDINSSESNLLISSIFSNYDVEKVEIFVNNIKKYEKIKKDIEKQKYIVYN